MYSNASILVLRAKISVLPEDEFKSFSSARSGMRISMTVGGDAILSIIYLEPGAESELISLGGDYTVRIELPYGSIYADKLFHGIKFSLVGGSRVFANGEVLEVL